MDPDIRTIIKVMPNAFIVVPSKRKTRLNKTAVDARLARVAPLIAVLELQRGEAGQVVPQSRNRPGEVWNDRALEEKIGTWDMDVFESVVRVRMSTLETPS